MRRAAWFGRKPDPHLEWDAYHNAQRRYGCIAKRSGSSDLT
jgi:hypothetical protein